MKQTPKHILLLQQASDFFSTPLSLPFNNSKIQQNLSVLQNYPMEILLKCNADKLMIQRYYEIVKLMGKQNAIQEFILIKLIGFMGKMIQLGKYRNQQLVIVVWAAVSHVKKCLPYNQYKEIIKEVLGLIEIGVDKMLSEQSFSPEQIYPQLSSILFNLVQNTHLTNHLICKISLKIVGKILERIFKGRQPILTLPNINAGNNSENSFDDQCMTRLEKHLNILIRIVPALQLVYYDPIQEFVQILAVIARKYIRIICVVALLGELVGANLHYQTLPSCLQKQICHSLTQRFVSLLKHKSTQKLQHNRTLKQLQKLSGLIKPNKDELKIIKQKFTNSLYLIHNNKSLIIPHVVRGQSIQLIQLTGTHSFFNYPIGVSTLVDEFNFQCERVLLTKIPYAETSLSNIKYLKKVASSLEIHTAHQLMSQLIESIGEEQGQYMIDMSLTKFCQFVTKILLLYWITLKPNIKIKPDLALSIFHTLNGCQAIRVLKPSFQEEEVLIGITFFICYKCYSSLIDESTHVFGEIKKLKLKFSMLEMAINNVYENSYMIRTAAYYILLSLSAPQSISQSLTNLQSTLINRNINNMQFLICLIKLCELSGSECEDLADKFMQYNGSQQLLRIIMPKLKTETIRKCVLSMSGNGAKWVNLLKGNTLLLYKRPICQGESKNDRVDNFYMNDGPNVQITNSLGVLLLQIGDSWQFLIKDQSPHLDVVLDLLLQIAQLDSKMVFFKVRFVPIFKILTDMLLQSDASVNEATHSNQRKRQKIYRIFSNIDQENFLLYYRQLQKKQLTKLRTSENLLLFDHKKITEILKKKHKKYQLSYLLNATKKETKQILEASENVIQKLEKAQTMIQESRVGKKSNQEDQNNRTKQM